MPSKKRPSPQIPTVLDLLSRFLGEQWEEFYRQGIMAIGWDELQDLRRYQSKDDIRRKYLELWPSDSDPRRCTPAWQFPRDIRVGDIVFVNQGRIKLLGYGIFQGDYCLRC